jgi:hypothetical protein
VRPSFTPKILIRCLNGTIKHEWVYWWSSTLQVKFWELSQELSFKFNCGNNML